MHLKVRNLLKKGKYDWFRESNSTLIESMITANKEL